MGTVIDHVCAMRSCCTHSLTLPGCRYHEVFQHGSRNVFIVMEYGQGGDLQAQIKRKRTARQRFPEPVIVKWLVQICLALEYLHKRGKIHRCFLQRKRQTRKVEREERREKREYIRAKREERREKR